MRKLLTLLLTFVMVVCLVNLNNNHTKAEEEEVPQETEVQETLTAANIADVAELEGETEDINNRVHIHSTTELIAFLKQDKAPTSAVLINDITYDTSDLGPGVVDIELKGGHKYIDLDGKSITFKSTLSLYTGKDEVHLTIYNGDSTKNSVLKPSSDLTGYALIATRLYRHDKTKTIYLNIGRTVDENASDGKVVFDGKGQRNLVGIGVGYYSLLHDEGYYNNNYHEVEVRNAEFKNFGSDDKELSKYNIGAALANVGGTLIIKDSTIHDNCTGVATGKYNDGYTPLLKTTISSTQIKDNYYGVINGMYLGIVIPEGILPRIEIKGVEPGAVTLNSGTVVTGNMIGTKYYYDKPDVTSPGNDDPCFTLDEQNTLNNGNSYVDYYCSGKDAVYYIKSPFPYSTGSFTKFALDPGYWQGTAGVNDIKVADILTNITDSSSLISLTEGYYANFVTETGPTYSIHLKILPTDVTPEKKDAGDMKIDEDGVFTYSYVTNGASSATAHITGAGIPFAGVQVKVFNWKTGEFLEQGVDKDYQVKEGSVKVVFNKSFLNKLPAGTNDYTILMSNTNTPNYTFHVSFKVSNPPDPGKKDESCEKVIGPTWHWNNDKGICEDYGVVGTSTR